LTSDYKVIVGGAMMGYVEDDLDKPVTKTTGALIVLPSNHCVVTIKNLDIETAIKRAKSVCCQCNQCTDMCPRYLLGHKLRPGKMMRTMTSMIKEQDDFTDIYEATLCSECGLCGCYACTMGLNPSLVNRYYKALLNRNGIRVSHGKEPIYEPNSSRQYRKTPASRLISRIGLTRYDRHLPFIEDQVKPNKLILPLKQHIGAPAAPVVKVGDRVMSGQLIASIPQGSLGANLHAPLAGLVVEISQNIVINC
jgi:Na+-translocating ferredoxin:NAD+ oxidoreductase RnfC subunit